jgi:hypothetical protein
MLGRMKQWARALSHGDPAIVPVFDRIKRCQSLDDAMAVVSEATECGRDSSIGEVIAAATA